MVWHNRRCEMTKIADNFCGYLNISHDTFAYNISDDVVTLLPTQFEQAKRYEVLDRIRSHNIDLPEYLYGVSDNNYKIAMLRTGKFSSDLLGLNPSIRFRTCVILKASGNAAGFYNTLTEDWNKYHAITFYGGNINALCNPQIAVKPPTCGEYIKKNSDGAREIKIRPWADYTRSVDFELYGEKATLTISIMQTGETNNLENMGSYSLGELNSFIRLSFENAQSFDNITKHFRIIKSLIAILTMHNNVFFNVYLSQKNFDNQYFKTAVCKIFDHYENYSKRTWNNVIPIYKVFCCIPTLISKILKNEIEPLLALLPEDNKRVNQVSITNVQDLCTALEVAYDWGKWSRKKDFLIDELKNNIKETITRFTENHNEIDTYKETTISSAFKYLDYTLKQKILAVYNENCDVVDEIISKWSLPQVDEASVGSFVNLRNKKTHDGIIDWGDNANFYMSLFVLEYASLFSYIGLSKETIKSALLHIF